MKQPKWPLLGPAALRRRTARGKLETVSLSDVNKSEEEGLEDKKKKDLAEAVLF